MGNKENEQYMVFFKDFYQYIELDYFDNFKKLLDRIVKTESLEYDDIKTKELVDETRSNQGADFNLMNAVLFLPVLIPYTEKWQELF